MSTQEVWAAIKDIADSWSESRIVVSLRREIDLIVVDIDNPAAMPALLRITSRGTSEFYSHPIWLYRAFPYLGMNLTQRDREFSSISATIDRSLIYLTWWIRSKLPGFPNMPIPQLAANSFHSKFDPDMPWAMETLPGGVQYVEHPAFCDASLEVRSADAMKRLAESFLATPSWLQFSDLYRKLDRSTLAELFEAKQLLEERAQEAAGGSGHEYADPTVRWNRSRAMTTDVLSGLSPFAAKFASTFETVNSEINRALQCVLPQLIAFGPPRQLRGVSALVVKPGEPPVISFQLESQANTGGVYWTDDSVICEAIMIESYGFGASQVHGERNNASAVVLSGTSSGWSGWRGDR